MDTSQTGVGYVLLQDGRPVPYRSATLTPTQDGWAQIKKVIIAVIAGCEHYHYYVCRRTCLVQTDRKPPIRIVNKSLNNPSPRLQRMGLRSLRYRPEIVYHHGKLILIAYTLSRDSQNKNLVDTKFIEDGTPKVNSIVTVTQEQVE